MNRLPRYLTVLVAITLIVPLGGFLQADDHAYVGSKKCKTCHLKEWKSWSETKKLIVVFP